MIYDSICRTTEIFLKALKKDVSISQMQAAHKILRYLTGTIELEMTYQRVGKSSTTLKVMGGKLVTGYHTLHGETVISR